MERYKPMTQFINEISSLASVDHENVIGFRAILVLPEMVATIMEYAEHGTFDTLLKTT